MGICACSAGNHAQGVAFSASALDISVIGVEAIDSAAMTESLRAKEIVTSAYSRTVLRYLDPYRVARVGDETFRLCSNHVDDMITVSTDRLRFVSERADTSETHIALKPRDAKTWKTHGRDVEETWKRRGPMKRHRIGRLAGYDVMDLSQNELAKTHGRSLIGSLQRLRLLVIIGTLYVYPFYKPGADPAKVLGANERMYSQCKRIQIAYDFVTEVFESREGVRYEAFVRARPDGVFLRPVPSMSSFDISKLTISASAPGDHWHLIHRGCVGPFERKCLRCRGKEFDKKCPKPTKVYDARVQEVVAREHPADVIRSLQTAASATLPERSATNEAFGYLWLECDRWEKVLTLCQIGP
eukprot:Skav236769  [mRNA]  locus=scaffold2707:81417:101937:+ [translate_table: standard]